MDTRQSLWLRRALVVYALTILGAGWAYFAWEISNDRQATTQAAQDRVATVSATLGDAVLTSWRMRARRSIQFAVGATVSIGAITAFLFVLLRRRYDALQRSEERYQLAAAGTNEGIWDWDPIRNEVYFSPRYRELLGYSSPEEFPSRPRSFWERVHPDDHERVRGAAQRHLVDREHFDIEYRVRVRSGEYRWFRARAQSIWDEDGTAVMTAGAISDIDDQKKTQQSLREAQQRELRAREEFAQRLLTAQEQERKRVASELHDSLGQNLSLIANRAQLALLEPGVSPPAAEHVKQVVEITAEAIREVRALAHNLRPLHIEQLGLTESLDALVSQFGQSGGIRAEKHIENVDDVLTGAAATHVYRIVQEALNNVMRHATAGRVQVKLERDLHCVRLCISDDGCGFDPVSASQHQGLGITSISERAHMLGGTFRVDSAAGTGTTLTIELPVYENAHDGDPEYDDAEHCESDDVIS